MPDEQEKPKAPQPQSPQPSEPAQTPRIIPIVTKDHRTQLNEGADGERTLLNSGQKDEC